MPLKRLYYFLFFLAAIGLLSLSESCSVRYGFKDVSIPDTVKTIRINFIENRAPYVNAQLSPRLTEQVRRKVTGQTKLTVTNSDNAQWDIKATITDYSVSTSGVSNKQETINRLTVTVDLTITKGDKEEKHTISRPFDFPANRSLQSAEASSAYDELIRGLTDDIFNRLFSSW
ncbi:MAG: hypothetical protein JWP88_1758 [Flaviaesturariibacter sp.]|nr:hypothetical protein [Flaviaesturariibacter sp.]